MDLQGSGTSEFRFSGFICALVSIYRSVEQFAIFVNHVELYSCVMRLWLWYYGSHVGKMVELLSFKCGMISNLSTSHVMCHHSI